MALRVLLADESSTIKRVIQLALQDYAVEVKGVPVGLDVLNVAKTFKPDVIFADILLPKRSGYEVCQDLKADPQTQKIPVILMWSGFMDLDEQKAKQCRAEGRLEKPFETEQLRALVQTLVPQISSNPLSSYLKFPKLPEFSDDRPKPASTLNEAAIPEITSPGSHTTGPKIRIPDRPPEIFDIDAIPEAPSDEVFQQVPLHRSEPVAEKPSSGLFKVNLPAEEDNQWAKQDIGQFKLEIPDQQAKAPGALDDVLNSFSQTHTSFETPKEPETRHTESKHKLSLNPGGSFEEVVYENPKPNPGQTGPSALDLALTEKVIREEAQKILEAIIWKILPDIAERVVKDEINKLLQDTEKSI